jgi:thymidylate synthase
MSWVEILAQAGSAGGGNTVTITTIIVAAFVQISLALLAFLAAQNANRKADTAAVKADKIVEQNASQAVEISKVKGTVDTTERIVNSRSDKQDAKIKELEAMVRELKGAASDRRAEFKGGDPADQHTEEKEP